ncbi:MAG: creatininase family protein, partial [Deltaproteobacteria bacterium]|nr:creatininase family protein [Deltaproteobacteria bacterium]
PHLPLGTDIYAATTMCSLVKNVLDDQGILSVIAPPYYFGMNETTGMFPGSISVKSASMISMLSDLLVNYMKHGFKRQFILNHHGDPSHNSAIVEAIRAAREQGVEAVLIMGGLVEFAVERALKNAPVPLPSSAVLKAEASAETLKAGEKLNRSDMHIHAEERETSLIMKRFPELIKNKEGIQHLKPVTPPMDVFIEAETGGKWRELSPLGYIGDPSVATPENAEMYELESRDIAKAIGRFVRNKES